MYTTDPRQQTFSAILWTFFPNIMITFLILCCEHSPSPSGHGPLKVCCGFWHQDVSSCILSCEVEPPRFVKHIPQIIWIEIWGCWRPSHHLKLIGRTNREATAVREHSSRERMNLDSDNYLSAATILCLISVRHTTALFSINFKITFKRKLSTKRKEAP